MSESDPNVLLLTHAYEKGVFCSIACGAEEGAFYIVGYVTDMLLEGCVVTHAQYVDEGATDIALIRTSLNYLDVISVETPYIGRTKEENDLLKRIEDKINNISHIPKLDFESVNKVVNAFSLAKNTKELSQDEKHLIEETRFIKKKYSIKIPKTSFENYLIGLYQNIKRRF